MKDFDQTALVARNILGDYQLPESFSKVDTAYRSVGRQRGDTRNAPLFMGCGGTPEPWRSRS
jgi:hypothetical protein